MNITILPNSVVITREPGDAPIYKESTFYYHVVNALRSQGYDVIRKNPAKDSKFAHLTDYPFYIRSRKKVKGVESFWLFDGDFMIRNICKDFNIGEATLQLQKNIFGEDK